MTVLHFPLWKNLFLLLIFLGACSDNADSFPDAEGISKECLEATSHSDLEWIQSNIFTKGCASASVCHQGAAKSAGGLNLEEGMTLHALSNVNSSLFPSWKLLIPGSPEKSYLMVILGDVDGPLSKQVQTMPLGFPLLCKEKRAALSRWIEAL